MCDHNIDYHLIIITQNNVNVKRKIKKDPIKGLVVTS